MILQTLPETAAAPISRPPRPQFGGDDGGHTAARALDRRPERPPHDGLHHHDQQPVCGQGGTPLKSVRRS